MKKNFTFILMWLLFVFSLNTRAQTQFWSETFETVPSSGTRTPQGTGGTGTPATSYFKLTDGSNVSQVVTFSGKEGSNYWAGEDHNVTGTGLPSAGAGTDDPLNELQINWTGINITGKSGLSFKGLFAANSTSQAWDNKQACLSGVATTNTDYIIVEYQIDGGAWTNLTRFYNKGSASGLGQTWKNLYEDTDNNGCGDGTMLADTFGEFTKTISGTGSTMAIRIRVYSEGNNEEWGIDNFRLFEIAVTAPTVSTGGNTPSYTTASLAGTVNDNNANTTVTFDWGVSTLYGASVAGSPNTIAAGIGSTAITGSLIGLTPGTTYHYRIKGVNGIGTSNGSDGTFTTLSLPTISTAVPTIIAATSAVLGGNVSSAGSSVVSERGVVYALTTNPTTSNTKALVGSGTGIFSGTVSGFESSTVYYVRAYATNAGGTSYGLQQTFTTTSPTITAGNTFPSALSTTYGVPSTSTSIAVSGTELSAGITATPSLTANFEVSSDGTTYGSSATIGSSGTVSGTVYVRLKANAPAGTNITGNVTLTSTDANSPVITIPSSTVSTATLTYVADLKSKIYGAAVPALTGTVTGFVNSENIGTATTGTFSFSTLAAPSSAVGSYAITGGGLSAVNYDFVQSAANTTALTITQRAVTVTANATQSKTYGNVDPTLTYTVGGSGLVSPDVFTGSLSRAAGENVGNYAITQGTLAANGNYAVTFTPGTTFAINQRAITVTANAAQSKTYGNVDPTLTYTVGGSGLVSPDVFTGSLSRAAGENVGNYVITQGTLAANGNYAVTFTPGTTFAINQRAITVTANAAQSKTYGNVDPTLTYTVGGSDLAFADTFSGSLSRAAGEDVGNYAITQGTFAASGNYNLTFTSGTTFAINQRAVTVTANTAQSKTYGNVDPTLTYTVGGSDLAFTDTFSGSLSRAAGEDVGNYAITQGSLSAGSNYTISYVSKDFSVTAKAITVTATASQTKVYGTTDPIFAYSVSPSLVGSDTFTGALTRAAGENIGTYAIAQGSLSAGSNYTISYVSKDFSVTAKGITVTATAPTKVYGTTDPIFAYSVSPTLVGSDTFTGALTRAAGENIGTYAITQGSLSAGSNYTISYVSKDFSVTAKAITVTATATQTKVYGTTDPIFAYSVSPSLVGSDTFTGALTRAAGENIGTYAIAQGSLSAGSNYTISYASKDFAITAKPITVTAAASQTKVYGTVDSVFAYTVSPSLVGSDTFTGALTRVAGENIGAYAIAQGSLSAGSNYTINYVSKDFSVTAKPITVTANTSQTKVYGSVNPILTYSFTSSLVSGDSFTGSLTRVTGENVGTYAITQGSLSAGSNYTISYISKGFTITAKPITVTANASQTKVYGAANPTLAYSFLPSLVSGDSFTGALARVSGENVGTYAITQGSLSAGSNYSTTYIGDNFIITKADQTITWGQTLGLGCDGETTVILTAISSSGLPVSYSSSNSNIVTISNDLLVFKNYGSATITASQGGNNNYNAAPIVVLPVVNSQPNLIRKQFENIIFFDNSSKNFKSYTWYKNGVLVPSQTAQFFKESGALNGTYYAVATKLDGTLINTCLLILSPTVEEEYIKIIPNPVKTNSSYELITNVSSSRLQNAHIEVYSVGGLLIENRVTSENKVTLEAPMSEGIYIVKMTLANGKYFTKNLLVKN
ncbi:T9SS type A sorting domain-containing protein [Flavobacterium ranwuense]|uniref:T9SS type A sorting domain-containing protein n=1 Tax=Flavobacterium ranwuense TaxID=2541725 RepID=A0ABY2DQA7_9FLAO|nr:MBG domain-containing protein [Flavobacterium ranwuense]TDE28224.1 T9SS type A sorting domain-containing protein [Flavobacterium ranwuense]